MQAFQKQAERQRYTLHLNAIWRICLLAGTGQSLPIQQLVFNNSLKQQGAMAVAAAHSPEKHWTKPDRKAKRPRYIRIC